MLLPGAFLKYLLLISVASLANSEEHLVHYDWICDLDLWSMETVRLSLRPVFAIEAEKYLLTSISFILLNRAAQSTTSYEEILVFPSHFCSLLY